MNILGNIFDYIYDLKNKYLRMLGFFLFSGVMCAVLYIAFGLLLVVLFDFSIMSVWAGALGTGIGCGLVNAVMLTRKR